MRRYLKFIGIFTLFMILSGCSADTLDELRNNATGPAPGQTDIPNNGGVGGGPGHENVAKLHAGGQVARPRQALGVENGRHCAGVLEAIDQLL